MGKCARGWLTSPAGVLVGTFLVTAVVALLGNLSLELWHTHGDTGHISYALTEELTLFLLGSFVIWLFVVLLVALLGRLWVSVGIIVVLLGLLGFADQRKLELLTEPLYPADLTVHTDVGFLTDMVGARVVVMAAVAGLLVLAGAVLLGRRLGRSFPRPDRRTSPRWAWTMLAGRVVVVVASVSLLVNLTHFHSPDNYLRAAYDSNGAHWRPWHQSVNYTDNGVVAGLLYNMPVPAMAAPASYSETTMRRLVEKYSAAASSVNRTRDHDALDDVNIVAVLSESLSDPTRYREVKLAEDPIPYTRRLMRRTTSGNLLVPKYGGGTANVEFEVLTNMASSLFRPQMTTPFQMLVPRYSTFPSALRFFEQRGLGTLALHSFTSALYRRAEVYPTLGFDQVAFEDDMTHTGSVEKSPYISDRATFAEVTDRLRAAEEPIFFNVVTMQNHYPAAGKYADPIASTGMTDPHDKANLEHYARGLRFSDLALEELVTAMESSGEKTVLVLYGDHLPPIWRGSGMPARMRHETPFLVYTNFGRAKPQRLPRTSPVFLMNHALEAADAPVSPYYALLRRLEAEIPAMTHEYFIDPANTPRPWEEVTPEAAEVLHDYRLVMYDLAVGRRYSEDAMFAVPGEGAAS